MYDKQKEYKSILVVAGEKTQGLYDLVKKTRITGIGSGEEDGQSTTEQTTFRWDGREYVREDARK